MGVTSRIVLIISTGLLAMVSCGEVASSTTEAAPALPVELPFREDPAADPATAGRAVTDLGTAWFGVERAASPDDNLSISPTSMAVALAMTEPGAVGAGRSELQALLGIDPANPDGFHASMNALEQSLESRTSLDLPPDVAEELAEELTGAEAEEFARAMAEIIRVTNAAYVQDDYAFRPEYLDTVGRNYGAALNQIDFEADPDAAAAVIDAWVAGETNDRITELFGPAALTPDTVLVLVNALYADAEWAVPFTESETADEDFTRLDGSIVQVPLMVDQADRSMAGDGWVGASKALVGDLAFEVIVPDEGHFHGVAGEVGSLFEEFTAGAGPGDKLWLPRFEARTRTQAGVALQQLGLRSLFRPGHLLGMADSERLVLFDIRHEIYLNVNETGIEAAAATGMAFREIGGYVGPPPPEVRVDRPFLYRILDRQTGATLFLGQITDPTVGADD